MTHTIDEKAFEAALSEWDTRRVGRQATIADALRAAIIAYEAAKAKGEPAPVMDTVSGAMVPGRVEP